MNTKYTKKDLDKMHVDAFRLLCDNHAKGAIVGQGSWHIRVSNNGCVLVTTYSIKLADGWEDREHTLAL